MGIASSRSRLFLPFVPRNDVVEPTLAQFEKNVLKTLSMSYDSDEKLIKDIAKVHAELLFIHPFREGNGRTARLLANLMAAKQGHPLLNLEDFRKKKFDDYVSAIRQVARNDYSLMEKIIRSLF